MPNGAVVTGITVQFEMDGTKHEVNLDPTVISAIVFSIQPFDRSRLAEQIARGTGNVSSVQFHPAAGFPPEAGVIASSSSFAGERPLWWYNEDLGVWFHPGGLVT